MQHVLPAKPTLLEYSDLDDAWFTENCSHMDTVSLVCGPYATLECRDCGVKMQFLLLFGRPKTFEVYVVDGETRLVGRASPDAVRHFVLHPASEIVTINGSDDPANAAPNWTDEMFCKVGAAMFGDEDDEPEGSVDFAELWGGADCTHASTGGYIYGNKIYVRCDDCDVSVAFTHAGDGFLVDFFDDSDRDAECGRHGAGEVVDFIKEHVHGLELPADMADCMSDDPDRDARRIGAVARLLVRHGLLTRTKRDPPPDKEVFKVSVFVCDRAKFTSRARQLATDLRSKRVRFVFRNEKISMRRAFEEFRLTWPCMFDSPTIDIDLYGPVGYHEFCVRCYYSTLDDDSAGDDVWDDGCPKCGYTGYLLGLDGWRGSYMQNMPVGPPDLASI